MPHPYANTWRFVSVSAYVWGRLVSPDGETGGFGETRPLAPGQNGT
jgi:hypothetical protein